MALKSMTGFARAEGQLNGTSWAFELRSVNGRGLDVRFRLPPGHDQIEARSREIVQRRLARGSVNVNLEIDRAASVPVIKLNETALAQVIAAADRVRTLTGAAPATVEGLLAIRGVLENVEPAECAEAEEARQAALLDGLSVARTALVGAEKAVLSPGLRPGDAGWVIARHGALYAAEEGYDQRFEVLVAGIVVDFVTRAAAGRRGEAAILARTGRGPVGCVFVVREDDMTARLRLFLVEPAHRGTGLGHRLLDEALNFARAAGYRRMVLWTHASHRAACALYARAGFAIDSEAAAHAFGQPVIDQTWSRAL